MVRWTIHVDLHGKDRVMELSDAERSRITDVMDHIVRMYVEGTCSGGKRTRIAAHTMTLERRGRDTPP
jgi:hypothetical protein